VGPGGPRPLTAYMTIKLLSALVLGSALLHLGSYAQGPRRAVYLFKPLTIVLIILVAAVAGNRVSHFYKYAILAGLVFSLAGDIFLMLPRDRFIQGLVSFLLAHLCYIAAFTFEGGGERRLLYAVPFLLYGGVMLRVLLPGLGRMRAPVIVYMAVIMLMAWQEGSGLALSGALLFVVSDSILAMNRFRRPFPSAQTYVMSTYFMAQWLIALSA
jgi:uncharacterized membrane protein YhhN